MFTVYCSTVTCTLTCTCDLRFVPATKGAVSRNLSKYSQGNLQPNCVDQKNNFNEYHKENIQLSNKQILFNTFDDSLPLQMPISTQRKLRLLVLLQKKYLYTCNNIVKKPNLEEFIRKLFEQHRIENFGKQY